MGMKNIYSCYDQTPPGGKILDLGCLEFEQMRRAEQYRPGKFRHYGVDYCDPKTIPEGFVFKKADLNSNPIPFEDDCFDLVVAKHILEHLGNPIAFFSECIRVCKPDGLLYVETPSERSLLLPGMPFQHEKFHSLSFYDDPTHTFRPWTPQSFYRLTRYYACEPLRVGYLRNKGWLFASPVLLPLALITGNAEILEKTVWNLVGWVSLLISRKPRNLLGRPTLSYFVPEDR